MRAISAWSAALFLFAAAPVADDHTVLFDEDVNFATFRTFSMRDVAVKSERPELTFPAVAKTLGVTINTALSKLLKETPERGDLVVECNLTSLDYEIGPFGRANAIRPGRTGRGNRPLPPPQQIDFTEATIVIDLTSFASGALVWRGVYHDTEKDPVALASALVDDAAKLMAAFPPRKTR